MKHVSNIAAVFLAIGGLCLLSLIVHYFTGPGPEGLAEHMRSQTASAFGFFAFGLLGVILYIGHCIFEEISEMHANFIKAENRRFAEHAQREETAQEGAV